MSDESQNSQSEQFIRVNLKLSVSTHQKVKAWCGSRGVTIQGELMRLIDQAFGAVETRKVQQ